MSPRVRVLLSALLLTWCAAAPAGERYAFLVAVREYDGTELNTLRYTEKDLTDLAEVLKKAGYKEKNVVLMTQAAASKSARLLPVSKNIRKELDLLLPELDEDDSLLVAFSGHGVQFKGDKHSYFCPADAELAERSTLISFGEVYQALDEDCAAGTKLLLVDACRNDPLPQDTKSATSVVTDGQLLHPAPPGGIAAFFSCSAGQVSYETSDLGHGVFFNYVIEALSGKGDLDEDSEVSLAELEQYAVKNVYAYVRDKYGRKQRPERKGEGYGATALVRIGRDPTAPVAPTPKPSSPEPAPPKPAGDELARSNRDPRPGLPPFRPARQTLTGHTGSVNGVAVTADGRTAVSASYDWTLRVWDLATGRQTALLEGHRLPVTGVAVAADGRKAVSASRDKTLRVWDLATGRQTALLEGHTHEVEGVAVAADGRMAASVSRDKTVRVWDLATGRQTALLEGATSDVRGVAVTPDGRTAVSGGDEVRVWDLAAGRQADLLKEARLLQNAVPVGRDLAAGRLTGILKHLKKLPAGVAVTADGRTAVSGSDGTAVWVWDLADWRKTALLEGHKLAVNSVAVTADGRTAVSGSDNVLVWDLAAGRERARFELPRAVIAVAVTPDGTVAVAGCFDGSVEVLPLDPETP